MVVSWAIEHAPDKLEQLAEEMESPANTVNLVATGREIAKMVLSGTAKQQTIEEIGKEIAARVNG